MRTFKLLDYITTEEELDAFLKEYEKTITEHLEYNVRKNALEEAATIVDKYGSGYRSLVFSEISRAIRALSDSEQKENDLQA